MYFWICIGGVGLLLIAWLITVIFHTPWGDKKREQDTTRRETQKWTSGKGPFTKYRN